MRVVISPEAVSFVAARGGRLYVWLRTQRCCRAVTTLVAATEPDAKRRFRRVASGELAVYVPEDLARLPDELVIEMRGRRGRVEAYWDGCVWVT